MAKRKTSTKPTTAQLKADHKKEITALKKSHKTELTELSRQVKSLEENNTKLLGEKDKQIEQLHKDNLRLEKELEKAQNNPTIEPEDLEKIKEEAKRELLADIEKAAAEEEAKQKESEKKEEESKALKPFTPDAQIIEDGIRFALVNNPGGKYGAFSESAIAVQQNLFNAQKIETKILKVPANRVDPKHPEDKFLLYRAITQPLPSSVNVSAQN